MGGALMMLALVGGTHRTVPLALRERLVFSADARLHLELPDRPDAAFSGGDDGALLPQPRAGADHQPSAMAYGDRWRPPLRRQDRGAGARPAAQHAGAADRAR